MRVDSFNKNVSHFKQESKGLEEWLQWRMQGIGASSSSTLFNCNPFESRLDLWNKISGRKSKTIESARMTKGKGLEVLLFPELRKVFKTDIVEQMCLQHPEFPYIRATLDGINVDKACIWEMKFIGDYSKYLSVQAIPMAHKIQIQQQLLLADACFPILRSAGDFIEDSPLGDFIEDSPQKSWKAYYIYSNGIGRDGIDWRLIEEKPDLEMQADIVSRIKSFWENHILTGIPPEAAPIDAVTRQDQECLQRCNRLKDIIGYVEEAEQIKKELKEMGGAVPFRCSGVNYSFNTKLATAKYKEICELPCVLKSLKDNNISMDSFRDDPVLQKRIWFD